MATNGRTWPLRLKERCEAVGWIVTMSRSGHYKVRTKRGKGFSFPSTPGDRRSELNAIAEAKRHGLERMEASLARTSERDRQERIRRDRTSVGAALVDAAVANEDENEEGSMEKEVAQKAGALGYVDGVAIAERAPAMHQTPLTHGKSVPLVDGEELLLADGTVVYRCAKPAATVMDRKAKGICHRTFDSASSLKAHISYHSRTTLPVTPAQRRKIERESTRERVAKVAKAAAKKAPAKAAQSSLEEPGIVARIVELTNRVNRLSGDVDQANKELDEVAAELATIAQELPDAVADEETLDKARRYEELRKLMG